MKTIKVYTDGGSRGNPGPAAIGVYVTDENDQVLAEISKSIGNSTNNYSEYQAVAVALESLKKEFGKKTKAMNFDFKLDSELVKKQLTGEYQIKDPGLVPVYMQIHNLLVSNFPHITFTHVPRAQNKNADRLVNQALDKK